MPSLADVHRPPRDLLRDLLRAITGSRANYRASYAIDLLCPLILGYLGFREATTAGWLVSIASAALGLIAFSFVEYAIHRWLFHGLSGAVGAMHQAHHDAPHGHTALPCITGAVVAVSAWSVLRVIVGSAIACCFLCGLLSGYVYYAALHHLEHRVRLTAVPFRWLQRRWAMHAVHHRLADTNFGVTTSLWDRVFGTHYQSRVRTQP
jgi:4-hydroxysphinganine ceramide fatty acyl 2-hydroxylase